MTTISLRDIPEPLYQRIKDLAEQERRSINQQILALLERAMTQSHRSQVDTVERIHFQRTAIQHRTGLLPDSTVALLQDRDR